jgi:hypothetical protein
VLGKVPALPKTVPRSTSTVDSCECLLSFTTSILMNKVYIFSEKSNYVKFDQIFRINH